MMSNRNSPPQDPESNDLREMRARTKLVNALRECGELADGVEHFTGSELLEVLAYLDSLRLIMVENQMILQGVARGDLERLEPRQGNAS